MANIYGLLSIGQSALLTQQRAIDITGNNIANVNTPGYSRQRLTIVQKTPVRDVGGQTMSAGVTSETAIQRFYDQFIGAQLSDETENLGRWEAKKDALEKAELIFDESTTYGLSNAMSQFWNAWQDLANDPSGVAERTSLVSTGQYLSDTFNQIYGSLRDLQSDIDIHVTNITSDVNDIAGRIADVNSKVTQIEVGGHNANELRDERDQLILELSKLIDIQSYEDNNGNINISVGNGKPLVDGSTTWDLTTADNGGAQDVFWESSDGTLVNITNQLSGGELKGWVDGRDVVISDYMTQLDTLAQTIISEVNTLHSAGITLDTVDTTGVDFFSGTSAANIAVNSNIVSNTDLIAAAAVAEGLPGGNSTAMAIAALQSSATMSGSSTFDDYYNSLISKIGADVQSADFNENHQDTIVKSIENYKQEVSGVSLDEEMIKLVQFQQAYNAAAKLITTADEMLSSLMNMVR
jgi:flagellar hook-associated protein 1 FlgK